MKRKVTQKNSGKNSRKDSRKHSREEWVDRALGGARGQPTWRLASKLGDAWLLMGAMMVVFSLMCVATALYFVAVMAGYPIRRARKLRQREAQRRYQEKLKTQSRERHRIKKYVPTKPCPSVEEVCARWDRSHDSLRDMIDFGLLLFDVEPHVDNSLIMGKDEAGNLVIVGRMPGLKGWLAEHCPHIGYKTAMYYKSLAMKSLKSGKSKMIIGKSRTLHELREALYKDLGIVHYRLGCIRAKRRVCRHDVVGPGQGRNPYQSLIFGTRAWTLETIGEFHLPPSREAQRLSASFRRLADEICANNV